MFIVNIKGGLGNQLFQCAFGLRLEQITGRKMVYLIDSYENYTYGHSFLLQGWNKFTHRELAKGITRATEAVVFRQGQFTVPAPQLLDKFADAICKHELPLIDGYFQHEDFLNDPSLDLRSLLAIDVNRIEHSIIDTAPRLNKSIGLHVRRSDYGHHGLASKAYYRNAIKRIRDEAGPLEVFVCTDEYNYSKFIFRDLKDVYISKGDPSDPINDLYILSQCKHLILSNSTFSFWGYFLNTIKNRSVFFPLPYCDYDRSLGLFSEETTDVCLVPDAVLSQ